jgi:hypothetical protein
VKLEKLIAAKILEKDKNDLLVYCMREGAADILKEIEVHDAIRDRRHVQSLLSDLWTPMRRVTAIESIFTRLSCLHYLWKDRKCSRLLVSEGQVSIRDGPAMHPLYLCIVFTRT